LSSLARKRVIVASTGGLGLAEGLEIAKQNVNCSLIELLAFAASIFALAAFALTGVGAALELSASGVVLTTGAMGVVGNIGGGSTAAAVLLGGYHIWRC